MNPQKKEPVTMDVTNALSLGNLFPNLYQDYKGFTNYPLDPQTDREKSLIKVLEVRFALIELNLYLDNHPDDDQMAELFAKFAREHKQLLTEYEKEYGPISINDAVVNNTWQWNNEPWPWEK